MAKRLLIIFCLLTTAAFADETPPAVPAGTTPSTEFDREVMELRAQTMIDLVNEELRQQGVELAYPIEEDKMAARLLETTEKIFAEKPEALARVRLVDWKGVAHWIRDRSNTLLVGIRSKARLLGVDVAIAYVVLTVVNDVVPILITALGNPALAATILALPTGTALAGLYAATKSVVHRRKIISLYGGKQAYRYYQNLEIAVRKKMHLHKDTDIFSSLLAPDLSSDGEENTVILSNDGVFRDVLEFLKLKDRRLSFHDLKRIAKKHGIQRSELRAIRQETDDRTIRSALLFTWIEEHLSADELAAIKKHYAESFIHLDKEPTIASLTKWAGDSALVKNCDDLIALASAAPEGVSVPLVMETWHRVMLPSIADTFVGAHLLSFHKMVLQSEKLDILGRIAIKQTWTKDWTASLSESLLPLCSK